MYKFLYNQFTSKMKLKDKQYKQGTYYTVQELTQYLATTYNGQESAKEYVCVYKSTHI